MIELPLVLIAGMLGSSHCLGMCGPFALDNWRKFANLGPQPAPPTGIYDRSRLYLTQCLARSPVFAAGGLWTRFPVW